VATRHPGYILLSLIYLGFVSLGLPDGTLGVAWPAAAGDLSLSIGLAGVITMVVTLLSAVSGFASGRIVARFRTGPVVLVSCALTGFALIAIGHASGLGWLLLAAMPLGLGAGAVDAALNGFVARHYSGRQMNWLHACWGLGATCGPLVMGQAMSAEDGWRGGYILIGAVQLALAGVFLATLHLWSVVPERSVVTASAKQLPERRMLPANSFAGWLSPALFALYVALEGGTGLWAGSILAVGRGFSPAEAAWCTAGFFGAIMGGRIFVGAVVDRWGNRRLIWLGSILALLGSAAFAYVQSPLLSASALAVMGAGFAPVYPGLMHEVPRRFAPDAALTVIGRQSGAAYLGMAVVPAGLGWLAEWSLLGIPWAVVAGTALLLIGIRRLDRMS
jgi:MFS family permease